MGFLLIFCLIQSTKRRRDQDHLKMMIRRVVISDAEQSLNVVSHILEENP